MTCLKRLHLSGFKSIRELDLDFGPLTVLIGANGSGKSNLVSLFRMLHAIVEGQLRLYVAKSGGADAVLHYGSRATPRMELEVEYQAATATSGYHAWLHYVPPDTLGIGDEVVASGARERPLGLGTRQFLQEGFLNRLDGGAGASLGAGHGESVMAEAGRGGNETIGAEFGCMSRWRTYHFHDTSENAYVRKQRYIEDNQYLQSDAGNLASYLFMLRQAHLEHYERIVETIRLAAPFFGDFVLAPMAANEHNVMLNWTERNRDYLFGPHQLSDGTLRFAALATLFLQPEERLPSLIVVDEPELGLHPYALGLMASMVRSVSQQTQVILSTQSVPLIDEFGPEDIVVVDRHEGETTCRRLDSGELAEWLEEYSVGELWEKNVIGGRPAR